MQEIQKRLTFIETSEPQSERAKLYDLLADLTDEDDTLSDLDDLNL